MTKTYQAKFTAAPPAWNFDWDGAVWANAQIADIDTPAPESTGALPKVQAKLIYDEDNLYVLFKVEDVSVLGEHLDYNSMVCRDSCVEFFFRPLARGAYFNYEASVTGAHLNFVVRDWERHGDEYKDYTKITPEDGAKMTAKSSRPGLCTPEDKTPQTWFLQMLIPREVIEKYYGPVGKFQGALWSCNFYKCGDGLENPHWLEWSPVTPLNFHQPEFFGNLEFC